MRECIGRVDTPSQMKENGNDDAHSSHVGVDPPTIPLLLLIFGCCALTSPYASSCMLDDTCV